MKNINVLLLFCIVFVSLSLSSCQEDFNDRYLITENSIEFDDAIMFSVEVGKTYPVVSREISPTTSEVSFQVNMIGAQQTEDLTFEVRVVDGETTAVENRDFTINGGKTFTIAKGTSKAVVKVQNTSTGVGTTVAVLELIGTNKLGVSKNYSKVGFKCVYP